MKPLKSLGLALIALIALSIASTSVAMAELPEILPVPTAGEPLKFKSKTKAGTRVILETEKLLQITCLSFSAKGSFTSQDSGTVDIHFVLCKEEASGALCTSPGAEKGQILLEGEIQLVDILPTSTLALGLWLKPQNVGRTKDLEFKCGLINDIVLGSLIGSIDKVTSLVKTKLVELLWHEKLGVQELKTCELLKALCSTGPFDLTSKITSAGAEELSGLEAESEIEFEKEVEVHF